MVCPRASARLRVHAEGWLWAVKSATRRQLAHARVAGAWWRSPAWRLRRPERRGCRHLPRTRLSPCSRGCCCCCACVRDAAGCHALRQRRAGLRGRALSRCGALEAAASRQRRVRRGALGASARCCAISRSARGCGGGRGSTCSGRGSTCGVDSRGHAAIPPPVLLLLLIPGGRGRPRGAMIASFAERSSSSS